MLLQHQTVSRKTPNDGMLEITSDTAGRITGSGGDLSVEAGGGHAGASIRTMTCSCGKRGDGEHVHYFLESEALRGLTPGAEVRVELARPGLVRVRATEDDR